MKTSNITKSALALALGLCASGALAVSQDAAREDFQGDAFANGVNTVATNNLTWADTDQYSYVDSGKLVVDATTNAPTSATLDSAASNSVNSAIAAAGRTASFEAKVSFTPATDTPDIGGSDLRFALYAKAGSGSTNLVVYTGSETVTATEIAANTETTVKVDFTAANTFQVYIGGNLVAGGPFAFANNGTISKVEFAGNGEVDDLVFSYDLAPVNLSWPTSVSVASYTINGNAGDALTAGAGSATVYGDVGDAIVLTIENADGVTKTFTGTVGTDATIGDSAYAYTWADYLGDAVAGAYQIDDAADLELLRKGVASGLATSGVTFKQTANIDMASAGAFAGIGAVGAENATTLTMTAFEGTYDGNNKTISNITFTNHKGSGLFNLIRGATIKDLVVDTVSYEAPFAAAKLGGAMVVGNGVNCTLQHIVTLGSNGLNNPSTYNAGGIANRLELRGGDILVVGCTNNAAIYCVYSKVAGICPIVECSDGTGSIAFVDCANTGNIVANGTAAQITTGGKTPGVDGAAGILAYCQGGGNGTISFTNCVSTGTIEGVSGTIIGSIIGRYNRTAGAAIVGGSAKADYKSVNYYASDSANVSGADFATVDNGVATFVDAFALNGEYKVMADRATATFNFTAIGTISFDTALATPTYAITGDTGLTVTPSTSGTVTTYTATVTQYAVTVSGDTSNLTATWTSNGVSVAEAPATLNHGDSYSVTFAAAEGYAIKEGETTTFSGTATAAVDITAPLVEQITYAVTVSGDTSNLTATWTVNGNTVSAPATLSHGDSYSVTFAAAEGYAIKAGETTTFSGTATAAVSITAPLVEALPSYEEHNDVTVSGGTHELTAAEASYLNTLVGNTSAAAVESALASIDEDDFVAAALLNQDITAANAGSYEFNVTKIKKSGSTVKVTVKLTRSGTLIGGINGTLVLQTCATPTGTYADAQTLVIDGTAFAGTAAEATAEFTFTGVTGDSNKFFKAVIR